MQCLPWIVLALGVLPRATHGVRDSDEINDERLWQQSGMASAEAQGSSALADVISGGSVALQNVSSVGVHDWDLVTSSIYGCALPWDTIKSGTCNMTSMEEECSHYSNVNDYIIKFSKLSFTGDIPIHPPVHLTVEVEGSMEYSGSITAKDYKAMSLTIAVGAKIKLWDFYMELKFVGEFGIQSTAVSSTGALVKAGFLAMTGMELGESEQKKAILRAGGSDNKTIENDLTVRENLPRVLESWDPGFAPATRQKAIVAMAERVRILYLNAMPKLQRIFLESRNFLEYQTIIAQELKDGKTSNDPVKDLKYWLMGLNDRYMHGCTDKGAQFKNICEKRQGCQWINPGSSGFCQVDTGTNKGIVEHNPMYGNVWQWFRSKAQIADIMEPDGRALSYCWKAPCTVSLSLAKLYRAEVAKMVKDIVTVVINMFFDPNWREDEHGEFTCDKIADNWTAIPLTARRKKVRGANGNIDETDHNEERFDTHFGTAGRQPVDQPWLTSYYKEYGLFSDGIDYEEEHLKIFEGLDDVGNPLQVRTRGRILCLLLANSANNDGIQEVDLTSTFKDWNGNIVKVPKPVAFVLPRFFMTAVVALWEDMRPKFKLEDVKLESDNFADIMQDAIDRLKVWKTLTDEILVGEGKSFKEGTRNSAPPITGIFQFMLQNTQTLLSHSGVCDLSDVPSWKDSSRLSAHEQYMVKELACAKKFCNHDSNGDFVNKMNGAKCFNPMMNAVCSEDSSDCGSMIQGWPFRVTSLDAIDESLIQAAEQVREQMEAMKALEAEVKNLEFTWNFYGTVEWSAGIKTTPIGAVSAKVSFRTMFGGTTKLADGIPSSVDVQSGHVWAFKMDAGSYFSYQFTRASSGSGFTKPRLGQHNGAFGAIEEDGDTHMIWIKAPAIKGAAATTSYMVSLLLALDDNAVWTAIQELASGQGLTFKKGDKNIDGKSQSDEEKESMEHGIEALKGLWQPISEEPIASGAGGIALSAGKFKSEASLRLKIGYPSDEDNPTIGLHVTFTNTASLDIDIAKLGPELKFESSQGFVVDLAGLLFLTRCGGHSSDLTEELKESLPDSV